MPASITSANSCSNHRVWLQAAGSAIASLPDASAIRARHQKVCALGRSRTPLSRWINVNAVNGFAMKPCVMSPMILVTCSIS